MTIGNRVLELLDKKGLRQKDLAEYLGTRPSTVNGWKQPNRNPSSELIERICEFLDVSYEYLLTGKDATTKANLSPEDTEWLSLIHELPVNAQIEFRGEIKGYLKRYRQETIGEMKQAK